MISDRQLTANRILERVRDAGIDVDALDGMDQVGALYTALHRVDVVPPNPVDELTAELDAGTLDPTTLPDRVHEAARRTIDRQTWTAVRVPVAERIAARMLATLRGNLPEIHRQLTATFDTEAARLSDAVDALGDVNDAGTALDRGLEAAWRDVQIAHARLEVVADAVRVLPDLGFGTHGLAVTWFVPVDNLDEVADLPAEKPGDPLGRFVGWLRAGHTLELSDGDGKKQRDEHVRQVKQAVSNPFATGPKATPRARAEAQNFQRGAPVNQF